MWDKYIYLIGGVIFNLLTLLICLRRRDLTKKALLIGSLTFAVSFVALIFSRDYWHPPVLIGSSHLSFEDFFFDFGIISFVYVLYPALTHSAYSKDKPYKPQLKTYLGFVIASLLGIFIINLWLGFNSVILCSISLVCYTVVMCVMRPDLIKQSLVCGLILLVISTGLYIIFFDWLAPDYWDKYWYLAGSRYGVKILGNVPITEISWYMAWGLFGGISFPFVEGRKLVPLAAKDASK